MLPFARRTVKIREYKEPEFSQVILNRFFTACVAGAWKGTRKNVRVHEKLACVSRARR